MAGAAGLHPRDVTSHLSSGKHHAWCRQRGEARGVSRQNSLGVARALPGTHHKVQCWEMLLRTQPRTLPHPAGHSGSPKQAHQHHLSLSGGNVIPTRVQMLLRRQGLWGRAASFNKPTDAPVRKKKNQVRLQRFEKSTLYLKHFPAAPIGLIKYIAFLPTTPTILLPFPAVRAAKIAMGAN